MKLPGKRDRLRRSSADDQPVLEPSVPTELAEAGPAAAAPDRGARRAGLLLVGLGWLMVGIPGVLIVTQSASVPVETPAEPVAAPGDPLALQPLPVLEPLDVRRARQTRGDPRVVRGGPLPTPVAETPAEGHQAYRDAVNTLPRASARARQDLSRLAEDPGAALGVDAQRYLRDSWPALQGLLAASQAAAFEAAGDGRVDTRQRWDLALAALAVGRREARGGAPALGARWAVAVIRSGRAIAARSGLIEQVAALGQARLGEHWLVDALERYTWTLPELEWVLGEVDGLLGAADEREAVEDEQAEAVERAWAGERAALEDLRERVVAKVDAGGAR